MLLFSPKARRLLDRAVGSLPDRSQQESWRAWSISHPRTRREGDPLDDGLGRIPRDLAGIALAALEMLASDLKRKRDGGGLGEDKIALIENDLTFIDTVESVLIMDLGESEKGRAAA